ncbi:MAG: ATP-binding cassette domain-containing protein [Nevskiaceae bacterium]
MSTALEFRDIDVIYPRGVGRAATTAVQKALTRLDAGDEPAAISAEEAVTIAVRAATLHLAEGEICVLMGLSGSGKSTLLRAANGLAPVTRGSVRLGAGGTAIDVARCDAATLAAARRHRISMVFQHAALLPWRTVEENVGLGLELRGDSLADRERIVAQTLQWVGLADWAKRSINELSGGMQQRVGLARAFATQAPLLLMDEPFSALDPLIRNRLQEELRALQQRARKTLLFVSHDLDEALRLGDRIAIMDGGQIVQTGTPQDIVLRPATARVAEYVQHMNPLTALTAAMVMRPLAGLPQSDGYRRLDDAGLYRMQIDGDTPVAHVNRGEHSLQLEQVPSSLPLREVVRLRQSSGHPLLVTDAGRVIGVCDGADILRALGQAGAATR